MYSSYEMIWAILVVVKVGPRDPQVLKRVQTGSNLFSKFSHLFTQTLLFSRNFSTFFKNIQTIGPNLNITFLYMTIHSYIYDLAPCWHNSPISLYHYVNACLPYLEMVVWSMLGPVLGFGEAPVPRSQSPWSTLVPKLLQLHMFLSKSQNPREGHWASDSSTSSKAMSPSWVGPAFTPSTTIWNRKHRQKRLSWFIDT